MREPRTSEPETTLCNHRVLFVFQDFCVKMHPFLFVIWHSTHWCQPSAKKKTKDRNAPKFNVQDNSSDSMKFCCDFGYGALIKMPSAKPTWLLLVEISSVFLLVSSRAESGQGYTQNAVRSHVLCCCQRCPVSVQKDTASCLALAIAIFSAICLCSVRLWNEQNVQTP